MVCACAVKCEVPLLYLLNSYAFLPHMCFFLVRVSASNFFVKFCGQLQKLLLLMQLSRQLDLQIKTQLRKRGKCLPPTILITVFLLVY